ncbi:type II toxin-antitoxin system HipA family toxin [Curtobacterium sp. Leaf261]|uniref:type II toxin-antitoxin system HipA family toxin n=1 Tax=Curtobacterium sp. Leaf261 TaxID=1736311 RepID=UPI0006FB8E48|nr:type II toxin-antitoxin system HipA family toxin [Curtobacterium sp. Leaf261]KQO65187.1 hypothetical protein ASF23_03490 [Curtobacterium sp. Leaf261]
MIPATSVEVWVDGLEDEPVQVGVLSASFQGARNLASSAFEYDSTFLARVDRYPLSPDLPLSSGRQYAAENRTLFGAFADAAPDEWGQTIIEANHAALRQHDQTLPGRIGEFDFLTGVSDFTRAGALRLRSTAGGGWLSADDGVANLHDLERILAVAGRYEADEASAEDVAYLNDVATSPGGARPKANVLTGRGALALAKLPHSKDGTIDVEAWEGVALTLASNVGIVTPRWTHRSVSGDRSVLVVDRFDRDAGVGRIGYISAASALEVGRYDNSRVTYEQFSDTIDTISCTPRVDLREMFTRIALTILVNNVDDHWRNHGFLRTPAGWRLSPVFDVNPSPRRGSVTARPVNDDDDPRDRDVRNLVRVADAFRLTGDTARDIVRGVAAEVRQWPSVATALDIPTSQQERMRPAFSERQLEYAER